RRHTDRRRRALSSGHPRPPEQMRHIEPARERDREVRAPHPAPVLMRHGRADAQDDDDSGGESPARLAMESAHRTDRRRKWNTPGHRDAISPENTPEPPLAVLASWRLNAATASRPGTRPAAARCAP